MYGRRFWSRDQHEVEKTMPMFSQGTVTPVQRERERIQMNSLWCEHTPGPLACSSRCRLTGHGTEVAQDGAGVVREDSEVPSVSK